MSACLAQQEPLKIGYLGPEGTFSQQAVLKHFGRSAHGMPMVSIEEVFNEVESGSADFGVVPVENSGQGTIQITLDMFLTSHLKICGEVELRVHQFLLSRSRTHRGHRAHLLASAIVRADAGLAARQPAEGREDSGVEQRRSGASCAQLRRLGRDRRRKRGADLRTQESHHGFDRGSRRQHDAIPRDRPRRSFRRRATTARRCWSSSRISRARCSTC